MSEPLVTAPVSPFVTQFVRFWCCNMDLVHASKMEWPGFGYTEAEQRTMHAYAERVTPRERTVLFALVTVLTILCGALLIGVMFITLNALYPDPSKTPAAVFFFLLANAALTTCSGGLIGAILIAGWITGQLIAPAPESLPDAAFARALFPKAVWQITRMTVIMVLVVLAGWLFVPNGSKLDLLLRALAPTLAPTVAVLTVLRYAAGQVRRGKQR